MPPRDTSHIDARGATANIVGRDQFNVTVDQVIGVQRWYSLLQLS
jgi:hypothetical protein